MLTHEALRILQIRAPYDLITLKRAYRQNLLDRHPDKHHLQKEESLITVQDVKTAYTHLLSLYGRENKARGDRIVDLDEFDYDEGSWSLECRCGHAYVITEEDLEQGRDIVGCDGCSLFVRVTYEELEEDDIED